MSTGSIRLRTDLNPFSSSVFFNFFLFFPLEWVGLVFKNGLPFSWRGKILEVFQVIDARTVILARHRAWATVCPPKLLLNTQRHARSPCGVTHTFCALCLQRFPTQDNLTYLRLAFVWLPVKGICYLKKLILFFFPWYYTIIKPRHCFFLCSCWNDWHQNNNSCMSWALQLWPEFCEKFLIPDSSLISNWWDFEKLPGP